MLRESLSVQYTLRFLTAALFIALAPIAQAQHGPQLRLQADAHMAQIRSMQFSADGKRLVSAGADKDIRVWNLESGRTERVLRGQVSDGDEGEVNAIALSSDGRTLAVGGLMSRTCPGAGCGDIRLFNIETGELIGVLEGHRRVITGLAFAPDGTRLASASTDRTVRFWDVPGRRETSRVDYPEARGRFTNISFLPDGDHLVAVSDTANVHVVSAGQARVVSTLVAPKGERQHVISVSSDGQLVASAGDGGTVTVWRWPDAALDRVLEGDGAAVWALSFGRGATSRLLVSSGQQHPYKSRVFNLDTDRPPLEVQAHDNTVSASTFSPDGGTIATTGGEDHAIRLWSPLAPDKPRTLGGVGRSVYAVGFATEAAAPGRQYLAWGQVNPCPMAASCPETLGTVEHAIRFPSADGVTPLGVPELWPPLTGAERDERKFDLRRAVFTSPEGTLGREQIDAKTIYHPRLVLSGKERRTITTRDRGQHSDQLAYSFDPTGRWIASGGRHGMLDILGADGTSRARLEGHSSDVNAVAFDPSGRLVASGSSDQTVKLWNAETGEHVATLLYLTDGRWIIWTPQGYYAASPEGEKIIGWQFNRGPNKAADFLSAYELRREFYNPALVGQAITLASATEAVSRMQPKGLRLPELGDALPPNLWLVSSSDEIEAKGGRTTVQYVIEERSENPLAGIDVTVDSRKVDAKVERSGGTIQLDIPLHEGVNHVRVLVRGNIGVREERLLVRHNGKGELDKRGKLYVVAIGVGAYPEFKGSDLSYTVADARDFMATIIDMLGPSHTQGVVSRLLVNGAGGKLEPTRENIEDALALFRQSTDKDTVVLFMAGHGVNDPGTRNYSFLPMDASFEAGRLRPSRLVPWPLIESAINVKGLRLLFVDTCRSQSAYNERLINDAGASDVVVYSASGSDHEALEDASIAHGYFTYALIEGLRGKAARADGAIYASSLYEFISYEVRELTAAKQSPQFYMSPQTRNPILARRN